MHVTLSPVASKGSSNVFIVLTPRGTLCQSFKHSGDHWPLLGAQLVPGLLWRVSQVREDPTFCSGRDMAPLCPAWGHASWVTMSWDALARPCEALESSQEKEVGAPRGPPKIPTSLLHHAPVPSCPVSPGLLQNSAISEGPPAALASWPFCLGNSVLKQSPSLSQTSQQLKTSP